MLGEFGMGTKAPAIHAETLKTYKYVSEIRGNAKEHFFSHSTSVYKALLVCQYLQRNVEKIEFVLLSVALPVCEHFSSISSSLVASTEGQLWILVWLLKAWLPEFIGYHEDHGLRIRKFLFLPFSALDQPCDLGTVVLSARTLVSSSAKWRSWHMMFRGPFLPVAKDACAVVSVVTGPFVLCVSFTVSSLWSRGISGQGISKL